VNQPIYPSPRFPKDLILEILAFCAQVPVTWKTRKQPHRGQQPGQEHAWIEVSVADLDEVGEHELRTQYDPASDTRSQIVIGRREGVTILKASSLDETLEAYDLLERVRFRLHNKPARDLFGGIISLRDVPKIRPLEDEEAAGRTILCATMSVRWNYFLAADPEEPGSSGYVATVNGGTVVPFTPLP
jgi:hypothetical protein